MASGGFTAAEAGWLSNGSKAAAFSQVDWRLEADAWRADIPVAADGFEDGDVTIVYQVSVRTPWRPSAVLRIRGDHRGRICVNRPHREQGELFDPAPHGHEKQSSDHQERYLGPVEPPLGIPVGGPVQHGRHRQVLQRLADRYNIDLSGLSWEDPPEGVT